MFENDAIIQNRIKVNDMLVKIFKLLLVADAGAVILKAAGFIALPWIHVAIAAVGAAFVCLIPIACRQFRMDAAVVKQANIYCMSILCLCGYFYMGDGATVLVVLPMGLSCMYFDMKLFRNAALLSVLGFVLELFSGGFISGRFTALPAGSPVSIGLNGLQLLLFGLLLTAISRNVLRMLSGTYSFYDNINSLFSNIQGSSQSLDAAEAVILQGLGSLTSAPDSKEEAAVIEEAMGSNKKVREIISNINKSMENTKELLKYTQTMLKGKGKEARVVDEAAKLEEYGRRTMELVSRLSVYTDKIKEDLGLISIMIDESKLLSVNAAAEAENASSKGRGSAIIAMKVEKLAEETTESAVHIQELLNNVVSDAENTVNSVAQAYEEIFKSLELINRSVETLIKWMMYKNMN